MPCVNLCAKCDDHTLICSHAGMQHNLTSLLGHMFPTVIVN